MVSTLGNHCTLRLLLCAAGRLHPLITWLTTAQRFHPYELVDLRTLGPRNHPWQAKTPSYYIQT
jgi:hypothetical protein